MREQTDQPDVALVTECLAHALANDRDLVGGLPLCRDTLGGQRVLRAAVVCHEATVDEVGDHQSGSTQCAIECLVDAGVGLLEPPPDRPLQRLDLIHS